jgi:hypothetical protein
LSYSRQHELRPTLVDLNVLLDRALLLSRHELNKGRIAVVKELSASLPPVELDGFKIEQVFINLFTNALHALWRYVIFVSASVPITVVHSRTRQSVTKPPVTYGSALANASTTRRSSALNTSTPIGGPSSVQAPASTISPRSTAAFASTMCAGRSAPRRSM